MAANLSALAELPPIEDLGENDEIDDPVIPLGDVDAPPADEAEGTDPPADLDPPADPEPEAEAEAEESPDLADLKKKAEAFDMLNNGYGRNPIAFIQDLLKDLKPEQLAALGLQGQQTEAKPEDEVGWKDEELTAPERLVKAHKQHIQDIPVLRQQVEEFAASHSQYVQGLAYHNAVLQAQVEALLEAQAIALPPIDAQAVIALVQRGKSYAEAVKEVAAPHFKKAIAGKRAATPTPKAPTTSTSAEVKEPPANASFLDLFRHVKKAYAEAGK